MKSFFRNPFMDLSNRKTMFTNLKDEFKSFGISDKELKAAIEHAYEELQQCRLDDPRRRRKSPFLLKRK